MELSYRFKVCVFGAGGVGKTTLISRYVTGVFDDDLTMTLGMDFHVKKLSINQFKITLQIWDFAGEREFRDLLPSCVINSAGGIFMFDITRYSTLEHLNDFITIFKENNKESENLPIILVGGKLDLEKQRSVSTEDGFELAKEFNFNNFIECSSITGENVEKIFATIGRSIMESQKLMKRKSLRK